MFSGRFKRRAIIATAAFSLLAVAAGVLFLRVHRTTVVAQLLVEEKTTALTSGTTAFDAIDTSLPN